MVVFVFPLYLYLKINKMEIKCKICNYISNKEKEPYTIRDFTSHIKKEHQLTKEQYLVKYVLNNERKTCACGCGCFVTVAKGWNIWNKYYKDHKNFSEVSDETKLKLKNRAKEKKESLSYYKNINSDVIKDSFNEYVLGETNLDNISKKYGFDKRTLRDMWISFGHTTYNGYKNIARATNSKLGTKAKALKIELEREYYKEVYDFILSNPYKYNINSINTLFKKRHTVTTLYKNLCKLFGESTFIHLLQYGESSKEETFFIEILRFYFGKKNVKQGFRIDDKIYDVLIFGKVLIEYDGSYFHSTEVTKKNDIFKTSLAINNGYVIIRCNESSVKDIELLKRIEKWKDIN